MVRTEDTRARDGIRLVVEDEEIRRRGTYWKDKSSRLIPYLECGCSSYCRKDCSFTCRNNAEYYAALYTNMISPKLQKKEELFTFLVKALPGLLEKRGLAVKTPEDRRLRNCIVIKIIRKVRLDSSVSVSQREIQTILKILDEEAENHVQ